MTQPLRRTSKPAMKKGITNITERTAGRLVRVLQLHSIVYFRDARAQMREPLRLTYLLIPYAVIYLLLVYK